MSVENIFVVSVFTKDLISIPSVFLSRILESNSVASGLHSLFGFSHYVGLFRLR